MKKTFLLMSSENYFEHKGKKGSFSEWFQVKNFISRQVFGRFLNYCCKFGVAVTYWLVMDPGQFSDIGSPWLRDH